MSEYIYKARTNKEIRGYARERLIGNMLIPCLVTFFFFSVRNVFGMLMQLGVLGQSAFAFVFYIALFLTINSIFGLIQISLVFQLPSLIYLFFFSVDTIHSLLMSLGLFLIGTLLAFLIEAYLAPVYFVICDNPSTKLTWVMIITFSLMNKKNFFKYIGLQISFVPLYLLGLLSLGIGLLWVVPYAYTSYAYFYETLNEEFLLKQSVKEETSEQ